MYNDAIQHNLNMIIVSLLKQSDREEMVNRNLSIRLNILFCFVFFIESMIGIYPNATPSCTHHQIIEYLIGVHVCVGVE